MLPRTMPALAMLSKTCRRRNNDVTTRDIQANNVKRDNMPIQRIVTAPVTWRRKPCCHGVLTANNSQPTQNNIDIDDDNNSIMRRRYCRRSPYNQQPTRNDA